jgi:hypothetical protein
LGSDRRAVQVAHQFFEEPAALNQPLLEQSGVGRGNQMRNGVELPGAVHPPRITVDVVGNPAIANLALGKRLIIHAVRAIDFSGNGLNLVFDVLIDIVQKAKLTGGFGGADHHFRAVQLPINFAACPLQ